MMQDLQQAYQTYLQMDNYGEVVSRYANPNDYKQWKKYNRLKKKLVQWKNNVQ
jgi:hypothetical protein